MKEKMKRVCKRVYDGYQRVVALVGADRTDLQMDGIGCVAGFVVSVALV